MKTQWQPLMKPAFLQDMTKLPARDMQQIMDKITQLTQDPYADGNLKIQLNHHPGKPYRLRVGNHRIFYTFNQQYIVLFKIERRGEATYRDPIMAEDMPNVAELSAFPDTLSDAPTEQAASAYWERTFAQPQSQPLPEPITPALLNKLQIPPTYHPRLLPIKDEDGIYNCPGLEEDMILRLIAHMFERPLIEVMQQPDLVLPEVEDLLRYKEGDLLAFLLKLSPEQEKFAHWSLNTNGPTLIKGGPGTGKSTVALYRIRSLLTQLRATGRPMPNILFTTYTNALIRSTQQLLQQLLGSDAQYIRVDTADSVANSILNPHGQNRTPAIFSDYGELRQLMRLAITSTTFTGSPHQQQVQHQTLEHMGLDYLLQEINSVIVARQFNSLLEYQQTSRAGRKFPLNTLQRSAVWQVYSNWCNLLQSSGKETWQQRRARAASQVAQSPFYRGYDAVIIDEAQDLDPSVLRMLAHLCKQPNRICITADANQSIYGSGFSWSEVHEHLRFQGRTNILRANYRSTAEIGEAAQSYLTLTGGSLEAEHIERRYINNGPLPDVRMVQNNRYEMQLLASYFRKACRSLRLALGSCAVLCPGENEGTIIAHALKEHGIEATYMSGRTLDLARPGVKIMTLKSSKGLEFPIVALAGFNLATYPIIPMNASAEEVGEIIAREQRTLFVGMTRAMRALLVLIPPNASSSLFQGFDAKYWNFTRNI